MVNARYIDNFIHRVKWECPWGRLRIDPCYFNGWATLTMHGVRNNFSPPSCDPQVSVGIGQLFFTGDFERDLEQLREILRFYVCHELDEQLLVDGKRPFDPHGARAERSDKEYFALRSKWITAWYDARGIKE